VIRSQIVTASASACRISAKLFGPIRSMRTNGA
jgi:hypothetical protein